VLIGLVGHGAGWDFLAGKKTPAFPGLGVNSLKS
jgi:hypothetical protein